MSDGPRMVTPVQSPDETAKLTNDRVTWLKGIVGAAVATAAIGWGASQWSGQHALKEDVAKGQSISAATIAELKAETQSIRERVAVVETSLAAMKSDVTFIRDQLVEIARSVGARRVPEPVETLQGVHP